MHNLPPSLQLLFMMVLLVRMVHLVRVHRRTRLGATDRSREGREGARAHAWGFSPPATDLGLALEEHPERSLLHLPAQRTSTEVIGALFGYAACFGALLLVFKLAPERELLTIELLILGFVAWIGWMFLHSGSPLLRIELAPDELVFVIRYGIFFLRPVRFARRKAHRLRFRHQLQGVLGMETTQELAIVFLFVERPWHTDQRFITSCSPDAASWIVGSLEAWRDAGKGQ